jgi:hypothetical protein
MLVSGTVSRLGRFGLGLRAAIVRELGAQATVRFRFNNARFSGVDGGERVPVWGAVDSPSFRTQSSKRENFVAAVEGDNGGVAGMVVELSGGC